MTGMRQTVAMKRIAIGLLAVVLSVCGCSSLPADRAATGARPALLLISIDGLRPQDVTADVMPHLSRLAAGGVRAEGMRPSYPTLTFPNHYTLVTGLRPDKHGIVHNSMRDPQLGEFRLSNREAVGDGRWWGGEPVWVGAEKAGLRTATMFWPGSEAAIGGVRPHRWLRYDESVNAAERVRIVAGWLSEPPSKRPAFATLYFDAVDHAAHRSGPDSEDARAALRETDEAIGQLIDTLAERQQLQRTNIVLVSDHGFAPSPGAQVIALEDMATVEEAAVHAAGQVVGFAPNPGFEAKVEGKLLGRHAHYQCWRKQELPARWHYGSHPRVPPIVCQMDEGWDALPRAYIAKRDPAQMRGSHGYDNALPSMRAAFIAHGPAFKAGTRLPVFDNVDVYPLLMRLLGLPAAANDGDAAVFTPALTAP